MAAKTGCGLSQLKIARASEWVLDRWVDCRSEVGFSDKPTPVVVYGDPFSAVKRVEPIPSGIRIDRIRTVE
jgi:hypothetical protein